MCSAMLSLLVSSFSGYCSPTCQAHNLVQTNSIRAVPPAHIRQDHHISLLQPLHHLNTVYRCASNLHRHSHRSLSVCTQLEEADGAVLVPERRPPYIEHIRHPVQVNRPIHTQVWPCALRSEERRVGKECRSRW